MQPEPPGQVLVLCWYCSGTPPVLCWCCIGILLAPPSYHYSCRYLCALRLDGYNAGAEPAVRTYLLVLYCVGRALCGHCTGIEVVIYFHVISDVPALYC